MQTPVLATKLFAPSRRSQFVARSRLADRLDLTLEPNNRLTLVSAPAGFGKTTLVGDWLTGLGSHPLDIGFGWLSLDEDDNDLSRLLAHLVAALHGAGIPVDPVRLESHQGTSPSFVLTTIVNEVTQAIEQVAGRHWVLVLDDYHLISAVDVHHAVSFLLDHLPPRLHLLIATRSDPALPLSLLRSRGELTEIRAADLRFTQSEAAEFLTRAMGLDLSAADSLALEERTEGWIAGLQLAALSLRGIGDPAHVAGFIEAFTGSNRFVIDYLADEVLSRQPTEVREFLLRTAVLDQLSGKLCDALTTREDGRPLLEELERANLFLVPLDDERVWYRYHHLFADVLRARLLSEHPDEVPELHRRASDWYAAQDEPVRAVRHALAAEDFGRAARLMEGALTAMRRARQDSLLLTWMESLPESVVRRSPVLSIWSAWSHLMAGDLDAMEPWLQAAEAALAAGAEDPELAREWVDTEDLRTAPATISIYRASLAQARGAVADTVLHAQHAWDLAGAGDHIIRGQAGAFLGLAAWAEGNVVQALDTFGTAVRSLHAAGNLVDALDATVVLADMWIALGNPGRARELYERALQRATRDGEPYPRATADLHVGLAELDRDLGDLSSAEAHLETARVLAQGSSITESRHRWYVELAHVRAATGDYDAALQLLDEAEGLYRHGFYPDIRPIPAMRARLQISAGDLDAAAGWAHDRGLSVEDDPAYLQEYEHLTLVRLLVAEHRAGRRSVLAGGAQPLEAALALLDRLYDAAAAAGRDGSLAEIRTLQAEVRGGAHLPPHRALADPLSQRELDVLRLLDSELTGPEIARRLYVSVNTLRTHTKRIFTKLDVNTRAAAVRRARELGVLQPPKP